MLRLSLKVHPRSSRERLEWDGTTLEVWVRQPPVEGAATAAVERAVARWLGVAPSRVRTVAGTASRHKVVEVDADVAVPPAGRI